jgi:hypothetical protein
MQKNVFVMFYFLFWKVGFCQDKQPSIWNEHCSEHNNFTQLRKRYANVDFRPLQGFQQDWESTTTIQRRLENDGTSACVLHFNGDIATVVRWIGGPHTNNHLDVNATLTTLQHIIDPTKWTDLSCILQSGAPALCKRSKQENFQAYLKYGNQTSVTDNQDVFEQTIVKQSKQELTIIMYRVVRFARDATLLNADRTPSTSTEAGGRN